MGMMSCAGAESAAEEMLEAIEAELLEAKDDTVKKPLERLKHRAEEIIRTAKSGWY